MNDKLIKFRDTNRKEREESYQRKMILSEEKIMYKRKLKDNVKQFSKMSDKIIHMQKE